MLDSRKIIAFWLVFMPVIAILYFSLWMSIQLRYNGNLSPEGVVVHVKAFSILYLLWLLVFFIHGLFEFGVLRRYVSLVLTLVSAMAVNTIISVAYFYSLPDLILTPRRFLLIHVFVTFVLVLGWFLMVKYFLKNRMTEFLYLFSFDNELEELEKEINNNSYLGFKVLGHLNSEAIKTLAPNRDVGIILPDNLAAKPEIVAKFYELRKQGISFYNHKNFYEGLLRKVYLSQLNEVWFLENINYKEKRFYNLAMRAIDLLFGLFAFLLFVITYPVIALLIKTSSRGPVLFVQDRVGKQGKIFKIYKYRTMSSSAPNNTWTAVNDPRITWVGRFLRKSRIDELPQSINLLLGSISLVGPRPEQTHIVEEMRKRIPFYDERHLVKPGITGWAQLNIYAASLEETKLKLQYDLYYIKHRSLLFDTEIILKTFYYIFTWKGR